jgi:glycosyltransferase involved in cell wall biosynthesis
MRIIYHHRTHGTGAEGVHISQVIKGLRRLGHEVKVVSPGGKDPSETAGQNPFMVGGGLKRRLLGKLSRMAPQIVFEGMELAYNLAAFKSLYPAMRNSLRGGSGAVDLIYERQAFFLGAGAYLAHLTNTPYIVEVNELAGEKRVRDQVLVSVAKRIEHYVFERADRIIVVSDFLKEKIMESGVDGKKIVVMPNGVDPEIFTPEVDGASIRNKFGIEQNAIVIGFVGWLVPWHSLDKLIEVVGQLAAKFPVRLLLVGDGVLKDSLVDVARKCGVLDRLVLAGAVSYGEVPRYIKAMDICVIPASNAYRSPIKLFEYMAMGKAVVAPNHQPILRVLRDGDNGRAFAADDSAAMCAVLTDLVKDQAQREKLGVQAMADVTQNYLWSHNAEKVVAMYQEIRKARSSA